MHAPVIFIHYGNSAYLKYTLLSAKLFNNDKRVILLGDQSNLHYKQIGIEHYEFSDYATGPEIELFYKVYQFIAGKDHSRPEWTNFVLRRWFMLYNFIFVHKIEKFWTFDSDTLILYRLSDHEHKFIDYDSTEQCIGKCMNGFITNIKVVKGYIDKINELFQRKDYLVKQSKDFESYPDFAFTEMRAYLTYKEESNINSIRLSTIINQETFDDCICIPEDMETYDNKLNGQIVKKIYMALDGHIFTFHLLTKKFVKLNTINLSWVPLNLFKKILKHSKKKLEIMPLNKYDIENMKVLDIKENFVVKWITIIISFLRSAKHKLKTFLNN